MGEVYGALSRVPDDQLAWVLLGVLACVLGVVWLVYHAITGVDFTTKWFTTKVRRGRKGDKYEEDSQGDSPKTGPEPASDASTEVFNQSCLGELDAELNRMRSFLQANALSMIEDYVSNKLFGIRNMRGCVFQDLTFVHSVVEIYTPYVMGDKAVPNWVLSDRGYVDMMNAAILESVKSRYVELIRLEDGIGCDRTLVPVNEMAGELEDMVREISSSLERMAVGIAKKMASACREAEARLGDGKDREYVARRASQLESAVEVKSSRLGR